MESRKWASIIRVCQRPTGFIEPTPITHTVGQHHLKFHRPVLGTEDMAIQALPYSNIDHTRKIIITDLLRRVNAAKMARMKANQIRLTRERDKKIKKIIQFRSQFYSFLSNFSVSCISKEVFFYINFFSKPGFANFSLIKFTHAWKKSHEIMEINFVLLCIVYFYYH